MFLQKSQASGMHVSEFDGFALCLPDDHQAIDGNQVVYDWQQVLAKAPIPTNQPTNQPTNYLASPTKPGDDC
jgi:hypothetical protein